MCSLVGIIRIEKKKTEDLDNEPPAKLKKFGSKKLAKQD